MGTNMTNFSKLERFSKFRPKKGVFEDAKAWWRYAINAVIVQIQIDQKKEMNWKSFAVRAKNKMVYIELWKRKLVTSTSSLGKFASSKSAHFKVKLKKHEQLYDDILRKCRQKLQQQSTDSASIQSKTTDVASVTIRSLPQPLDDNSYDLLMFLEHDLSFEDIVLFRSLAEKSLPTEVETTFWGGWMTWLSGGGKTGVQEEEKRKFFEALRTEPDRLFRAGAPEFEDNELSAVVTLQVREGSLTIGLSSPEVSLLSQQSCAPIPFLKIEFSDLCNNVYIMGNGAHTKVELTLQNLDLFEILSSTGAKNSSDTDKSGTILKRFVSRRFPAGMSKRAPKMKSDRSISDLSDDLKATGGDSSLKTPQSSQRKRAREEAHYKQLIQTLPPLLSVTIETVPISGKEPEAVALINVEELQVSVTPGMKWIDSAITFFSWPSDVKYWSEMEMEAMNQLADLKTRIDAKLDYMLHNHSNFFVEANINAPVLIVSDRGLNQKDVFVEGIAVDDTDLLVIDLGMFRLHTDKLAKVQYQKSLESQSQIGANSEATSLMKGGGIDYVTPIAQHSRYFGETFSPPIYGENSVKGSENRGRKLDLSNISLQDLDEANINDSKDNEKLANATTTIATLDDLQASNIKPGGILTPNVAVAGKDEHLSSLFHRYAGTYASTVNTIGVAEIEELEEENLFDVFQLQVSQMEVYLIRASALYSPDEIDDYNASKAVIVDKFEVGVEIQSSVLPWDVTLPPVKLMIDISEVHIRLSEAKLIRLKQFALGLSADSQAVMDRNASKLQRMGAIYSNRTDGDGETSKNFPVGSGSRPPSLHQLKASMGSGKSVGSEQFLNRLSMDGKGNRASLASNRSVRSRSGKRKPTDREQRSQYGGSSAASTYLEEIEFEDAQQGSDDESYFSLNDEPTQEEIDKQIEASRYILNQRQTMRSRIMADIRVAEADPSKISLRENLYLELKDLDSELHQLKIQYVELMMTAEPTQLQSPGKEDEDKLRELFDHLAVPGKSEDALGYKRDLMYASAFKIGKDVPAKYDEFSISRALAYVKLNVSFVNVSFLCLYDFRTPLDGCNTYLGTMIEQERKITSVADDAAAENMPRASVAKLRLAGITARVKHRSLDSNLSFVLREIGMEMLEFSNTKRVNLDKSAYLLSSEAAFFGMSALPHTNKYLFNGGKDFLKIKYEVQYSVVGGNDFKDGQDAFFSLQPNHTIKVHGGFLGVNIEQMRIASLLRAANNITSFESGETSKGPPSTSVDKKPFVPVNVGFSFKFDCLSVALLDAGEAVVTSTIWSMMASTQVNASIVFANLKIADMVVDHTVTKHGQSLFNRNSRYTTSEVRTRMLGKQMDSIAPLLALSARYNTESEELPTVSIYIKSAPLVAQIAPEHILEVMILVVQGDIMKYLESIAIGPDHTTQNSADTDFPLLSVLLKPILSNYRLSVDLSSGSLTVIVPGTFDIFDDLSQKLVLHITSFDFNMKGCANNSEALENGTHSPSEQESRTYLSEEFGQENAALCISAAIKGIELDVGELNVVDSFDIALSLGAEYREPESINIGNIINRRAIMAFPSIFCPIEVEKVAANEMKISIAMSPIRLKVSEQLTFQIKQFISHNSIVVGDRIYQDFFQSKPINSSTQPTPVVVANTLDTFLKYQTAITATVLVYEVSVLLESVTNMSNHFSKPSIPSTITAVHRLNSLEGRSPVWKFSARKTPRLERARSTITNPSTIFQLAFRHITFEARVFEDGPYFVGLGERETISILLFLRSVDLDFLKASPDSHRRLLCTIASEESSKSPVEKSSGSSLFSLSEESGCGANSAHALMVRAVVTGAFDLDVHAHIQGLQFALLPDPVINMMLLLDSLILQVTADSSCAFCCHHADAVQRFEVTLEDSTLDDHSTADHVVQDDSSYAHPSSVPMSVNTEPLVGENLTPTEKHSFPLYSLYEKAFRPPFPIHRVGLCVNMTSCNIWIPSQMAELREDAGILRHSSSDSPGLCISFGAHLTGKNNLDTRIDEQIAADVNVTPIREWNFWSTNCCLSDISLILCKGIPRLISCPLAPIDHDVSGQIRSFMADPFRHFSFWLGSGTGTNRKVPTESLATLLLPTRIYLQHALGVRLPYQTLGTATPMFEGWQQSPYNLQQQIDVDIELVELQVFLDFRPLLKIYETAVAPVVDFIAYQQRKSDETLIAMSKATEDTQFEADVEIPYSLHDLESVSEREITIPFIQLDSLPVLCSVWSVIGSTNLTVRVSSVNLYIINDIYQHPVSLARLLIGSSELQLTLSPMQLANVEYKSSTENDNDGEVKEPIATDTIQHSIYYGSNFFTSQQKTFNQPLSKYKEVEKIALTLRSSVRMDYYNQKLLATEPLIEPFNITISVSQNQYASINRPILWLLDNFQDSKLAVDALLRDLMKLEVERNSSKVSSVPVPCPISLSVSVDKRMDINITMSLLEVVFATIHSFSTIDFSKGSSALMASKDEVDKSMMIIRNESGLELNYWTSSRSQQRIVGVNQEVPLAVDFNADPWGVVSNSSIRTPSQLPRDTNASLLPARSINIAFKVLGNSEAGDNPDSNDVVLEHIPLDGLGCRLFDINNSDLSKPNSKESDGREKESRKAVVAMELLSYAGVKTLLIRSTLKLFNSISLPIMIEFIENYRSIAQEVLWEALILPNTGIAVPANLCDLAAVSIVMRPILGGTNSSLSNHRSTFRKNILLGTSYFPIPEIVGLNKGKRESLSDSAKITTELSLQNNDEEYTEESFGQRVPNSILRWRQKLRQSRGLQDTLSYAHWLNFANISKLPKFKSSESDLYSLDSINCNATIVSKGSPRNGNKRSVESSMIRTINFTAPIIAVNLLACDMEVGIIRPGEPISSLEKNLINPIPTATLAPGESWGCLSYHSIAGVNLAIKLANSEYRGANESWSSEIFVEGCRQKAKSTMSCSISIPFKNSSSLTVQVDIEDKDGTRFIYFYVPYWVITSSVMSLQYQHDSRYGSGAVEKELNGADGLAADQVYEDLKLFKGNNRNFRKQTLTTNGTNNAYRKQKEAFTPRGIGKVCGANGIVLGPERPLRGFTDLLVKDSNLISGLLPITQRSKQIKSNDLLLRRQQQYSVTESADDGLADSSTESTFRLMQCGYTNKEKRLGRLRLKSRTSHWSYSFSLDALGNTAVDVRSAAGNMMVEADNESNQYRSIVQPTAKDGTHIFSFGILTGLADPPFNRTKLIVVVDRFMLMNSVGQSLEVKQYKKDAVFTLRRSAEVPMWWRPGLQYLQVRLDRYGWSWSGKFSLKKEGEIPIRLRNDYDNTVFFLLVHVIRQGPRVCVIFKGGDEYSPYRFENHSLDTFKVKQYGQQIYTNLLPYHCSAYAWDEPEAQHKFVIEAAKKGMATHEEWTSIGTFNFERLEVLDRKTNDHLLLRIVAQGPTRVLQIFDRRILFPGPERIHSYLSSATGYSDFNAMSAGGYSSKSISKPITNAIEMNIDVNIAAIGLSIVDQSPQELIYVSVTELSLSHSISKTEHVTNFDLQRLQIDNQLWSTPYPSLLYPLVPMSLDGTNSNLASKSNFLSAVVRRNFEYSGIEFIPWFKLQLAPFDVNLEATIISRMISMVTAVVEAYSISNVPTESHETAYALTHVYMGKEKVSYSTSVPALPKGQQPIVVPVSPHLSNSPIRNINYLIHLMSRDVFHGSSQNGKDNSFSSRNVTPMKAKESYRNAIDVDLNVKSNHLFNDKAEILLPLETGATLAHLHIHRALLRMAISKSITKPSYKIYIQRMDLSEIQLNFSFDLEVSDAAAISEESLIRSAVNTVILAIGSSLTKTDNCPIRLLPFSASHVFASSDGLALIIGKNYLNQLIWQASLILTPVRMLFTLGEGIWDFMYMPAVGLMVSPEEFAVGVVRGTSSLVKSVIASLCTTSAQVASAVQLGLINLGGVDTYTVLRRGEVSSDADPVNDPEETFADMRIISAEKQKQRPKNLFEGLRLAIKGFASDPMHGFKSDGIKGLMIGAVKGSLGLLARPMYGMLGFSVGVLDYIAFYMLPRFRADQKLHLVRARPPRFFHSPNTPLQIYSIEENIGQELLSRIRNGEYTLEGYLWHSRLKDNTILIMTRVRVLILGESFDHSAVLWNCPISKLELLEVEYKRAPLPSNSILPPDLRIVEKGATTLLATTAKIDEVDKAQERKSTDKVLLNFPILHIYHAPLAVGQLMDNQR